MLPQHLNQLARSQQVPSPSSSQDPRSPSLVNSCNGQAQANTPYSTPLSPQKSSAIEARTLLMEPSLNVGLAQYQQRSAGPRTSKLSYSIPGGHSSSAHIQSHQAIDKDHLSYLRLRPIRTSGTRIGEPPKSHENSSEHRNGKQSPLKEEALRVGGRRSVAELRLMR